MNTLYVDRALYMLLHKFCYQGGYVLYRFLPHQAFFGTFVNFTNCVVEKQRKL